MINNKNLMIVRHGERADHVIPKGSVFMGNIYDPQLSDHGEEQAREVGKHLKKYFGRIKNANVKFVCSPYLRTFQTCREICSEVAKGKNIKFDVAVEYGVGEFLGDSMIPSDKIHPVKEKLLVEKNFRSSGNPNFDISQYINQDYKPVVDRDYFTDLGRFETRDDLEARLLKVLDFYFHSPKMQPELDEDGEEIPMCVVFVTHAACLITLTELLWANEDMSKMVRTFYPPLVKTGVCSITEFTLYPDNTWALIRNGDVKHLSRGEENAWWYGRSYLSPSLDKV